MVLGEIDQLSRRHHLALQKNLAKRKVRQTSGQSLIDGP
jgi:hypothetical protein